LLEPDEQDEIHRLSRVGVAEKDRVLEFGPSRSEPFREAMKRFLVLDDRGLDERLGSFEEELPSALRSGHCTAGAHLRNVFYDFRKHLVLIHHSQLHMSVVSKYSRPAGGRQQGVALLLTMAEGERVGSLLRWDGPEHLRPPVASAAPRPGSAR